MPMGVYERTLQHNAAIAAAKTKDEIRYHAAHKRIRLARGRAADHACIDCGGPARDWAFNHDTPEERVRVDPVFGRTYSMDPDDYDPRCHSCHMKYDGVSPRRDY